MTENLYKTKQDLEFFNELIDILSIKIRSKIETCNLNHGPNVDIIIPDCPNP